jgi:outer membrane protein
MKRLFIILISFLPGIHAAPEAVEENGSVQADWGIAIAVRTASIPYASQNDSVSSVVPMLFYEGERGFWRGVEGGVHLFSDKEQDWELNAIGRLRFVDLPSEYQNTLQGDDVDFGLQFHQETNWGWWEAEYLTEDKGNMHLNARLGRTHVDEKWVLSYYLNAQFASSGFVSRYYALDALTGLDAGSSFTLSPGLFARYHLFSDVHLVGSLQYHAFGSEISDLPTITDDGAYEAWLGFGFFQDRGAPQFRGKPDERIIVDRGMDLRPNLRVMHAWATTSSMGDALIGNIDWDPYNNQLTSLFYEVPLTDNLFGWPVQIMLGTGYAQHWSSAVQDSTFELMAKIHLYYTFTWPIRWRVGAAEGFSWIETPTYIEVLKLEEKGYRPSQLMNYLDFSLDLNVGDLFRSEKLEGMWFGVSLHHRSSIFESASQFGRISGGSDYPGIHLQWDL